MCGALNYFLALVMLGFVPNAGVSITVGGVVGAEGSVGTMMSSSKHGQLIVHHYRANTQLRWRHGAARKFKECDHGAMGMQAEVIGPMQIRIGSHLVGLWSLGQSAADGLTSTSFKSF